MSHISCPRLDFTLFAVSGVHKQRRCELRIAAANLKCPAALP